jgi:hypothetical protein
LLRGSVFGYSRPRALEASYTTVQTDNGTVNTVGQQESDIGIEAGGRVVRDKVFFFGAINPSWQTRTFVAPDGFPLQSLGEVDRKRHTTSYSAKGTWQVANGHCVGLSLSMSSGPLERSPMENPHPSWPQGVTSPSSLT